MNAKEAYAAKPWLKYYPEGVPETVDIPNVSVPDLFDQVAENRINLLRERDQLYKTERTDRPFCYSPGRFRSKER